MWLLKYLYYRYSALDACYKYAVIINICGAIVILMLMDYCIITKIFGYGPDALCFIVSLASSAVLLLLIPIYLLIRDND